MCSICGVLRGAGWREKSHIEAMNGSMHYRGPDQSGAYFFSDAALGHNRLAIIDMEHGGQPMTRTFGGRDYTIVYNGELYNTSELTAQIREKGVEPETYCDTEVVLYAYILFGDKCASMLNGIFAFAIYDTGTGETYFARDRFGVKPLFYTVMDGALIFASEVKALLQYPGVKPQIDMKGLWELIFLSPVRLGGGVFRGICELEPAHQALWAAGKLIKTRYWGLRAEKCQDHREDIIANTRELLIDAIERQLVSDVPLCTLLSGGLDSSVVSSVAAANYRRRGMQLGTYSFEYEGNRENFHASLFQPESDDDYAQYMANWLSTDHRVLTAPTQTVADLLGEAAVYRDFPGQADIDSSLLFFCRRIKQDHAVAMSGECADEIFGGYPWFYRPEMLHKSFFPWIHDPMLRPSLFRDEAIRRREGYNFIRTRLLSSLEACPLLDTDSKSMTVSRKATWLSVNYFMASLLERKDRMSMAASVEVRVPFADHRIFEYVFNVPWEVKFENGVEKALLRNAMADYLPETILNRKKSPYPKTQNPDYEAYVLLGLEKRLKRDSSPLGAILDRRAFESFLAAEEQTWFGQLMSKPQLLAWLLQFDVWAEQYNVEFVF